MQGSSMFRFEAFLLFVVGFLAAITPGFGVCGEKERSGVWIPYSGLIPVEEFDRETVFSESRGYHPTFGGESEVIVRNLKNQRIIFRLSRDNTLGGFHCGICFVINHFDDRGHLRKVSFYNRSGKIHGDREFDNSAIFEYQIMKADRLQEKWKIIDEHEGNLAIDDEKERIVLLIVKDPTGKEIRRRFISSRDYWIDCNTMVRP